MTVLAHAGHWLVNLLYAAPVLALIALLVRDRLKHRSGGETADKSDPRPLD